MKKDINSAMWTASIIIIAVSFINTVIQVISNEVSHIWMIVTVLGLILLAMSSLLSEMKVQTAILKNIEKNR